MPASINNQRRYYLRKAQFYALFQVEMDGLMRAYWAKQDAIDGTALPADFPLLEKLSAAHYTTIQDLDGADSKELVAVGFSGFEARQVLDAFAALGA